MYDFCCQFILMSRVFIYLREALWARKEGGLHVFIYLFIFSNAAFCPGKSSCRILSPLVALSTFVTSYDEFIPDDWYGDEWRKEEKKDQEEGIYRQAICTQDIRNFILRCFIFGNISSIELLSNCMWMFIRALFHGCVHLYEDIFHWHL